MPDLRLVEEKLAVLGIAELSPAAASSWRNAGRWPARPPPRPGWSGRSPWLSGFVAADNVRRRRLLSGWTLLRHGNDDHDGRQQHTTAADPDPKQPVRFPLSRDLGHRGHQGLYLVRTVAAAAADCPRADEGIQLAAVEDREHEQKKDTQQSTESWSPVFLEMDISLHLNLRLVRLEAAPLQDLDDARPAAG